MMKVRILEYFTNVLYYNIIDKMDITIIKIFLAWKMHNLLKNEYFFFYFDYVIINKY